MKSFRRYWRENSPSIALVNFRNISRSFYTFDLRKSFQTMFTIFFQSFEQIIVLKYSTIVNKDVWRTSAQPNFIEISNQGTSFFFKSSLVNRFIRSLRFSSSSCSSLHQYFFLINCSYWITRSRNTVKLNSLTDSTSFSISISSSSPSVLVSSKKPSFSSILSSMISKLLNKSSIFLINDDNIFLLFVLKISITMSFRYLCDCYGPIILLISCILCTRASFSSISLSRQRS